MLDRISLIRYLRMHGGHEDIIRDEELPGETDGPAVNPRPETPAELNDEDDEFLEEPNG